MKEQWTADEAVAQWDEFGAEFASHVTSEGDPHREVLLNPVLLELIGTVDGKRVLDAGCGEGYLSRMLAAMGASVVAVDYSRKMLEIARDRTQDDLDIEFQHGNMEGLDLLEDASFDVVVSNMVLMGLPKHELAIAEANRLLVSDGSFIFSISHPCFEPPTHGWVKNEAGEKLYWKVDRYFDEIAYQVPWSPGAENGPPQFHRTLSSYFRVVIESGFTVESLVEPSPLREKLDQYPEFVHDFRMCHFLVFKARKQAIKREDTPGG